MTFGQQRSRLVGREVTVAHWTVAGVSAPIPFADRVTAARDGGVSRIGWTLDDYQLARAAGQTGEELRRISDDCGVSVVEIEFLRGWAGDGGTESLPGVDVGTLPWTEQERLLHEMADVFDADHVHVGDDGFGGDLLPWEQVVDRFGGICERFAAQGVLVGLEPMPWTLFADLADGWRLLDAVGAENSALLLDTWHFFRGIGNFETLDALPAEAIGLIQINDAGPPVGELFEDTMQRRRWPGDGEFDLPRLFAALAAKHVVAPVSVEVMSEVVEAMTPPDAVARARETATRVLEATYWH